MKQRIAVLVSGGGTNLQALLDKEQAGGIPSGEIVLVLSNLRAAPFDTFMGGALVEANYPLGPLTGAAVNVTTMSYRGVMNVGIHADTAALKRPEQLAEAITDAFEVLTA